MNKEYFKPLHDKVVPLLFVAAIMTLLSLFASPQVAFAADGGTQNGTCMVDRFNATKPANNSSLNCTSNDVQLAEYELISGPSSCIEGEDVTVILKGEFVATSAERWDVGVFVAQDGGTPNDVGGSCYSDFLHPASTDNSDLNLTGGAGPFHDGEITEDPSDVCGDIEQGNNAFFTTAEITIKCQDSDNNNVADVESCTVWANSRSAGTDGKPSCVDEGDVTAETTAKCTCGAVEISGLAVPGTGTIEVVKTLIPATDTGTFDLLIDGSVAGTGDNVGNGGTTGAIEVTAGTDVDPGDTHAVGELASDGSAIDATRYDSSYVCTESANSRPSVSGTGTTVAPDLNVQPNDVWTCTFTNTLRQGTLIVKKLVVNDNGGMLTADDFGFQVDGGAATAFDEAGGGSTDPLTGENSLTLNAGTYAITEPAVAGYTTTDNGNCASVVVTAGGTATCEFTNNDKPAKLTVVKTITSDNGGTATLGEFDVSVDGTEVAWSDPASMTGGSQVITDQASTYTLSEGTVTGYDNGTWSCTGAADTDVSDGNITVALGEDVTCSITNNDIAPSLTLVKKAYENATLLDPTPFNLIASGPTPISGAGGTTSSADFQAGTYTLSETGPSGFLAQDWSCTGEGDQSGTQITLELGESATCTIINIQLGDLCGPGKPTGIYFIYDADSDSLNSQSGNEVIIDPADATLPDTVYIEVFDTTGRRDVRIFDGTVSTSSGPAYVQGRRRRIPPRMTFRIYDENGGTLLQTVQFHTSCSQPLNAGDEFGGITLTGANHD